MISTHPPTLTAASGRVYRRIATDRAGNALYRSQGGITAWYWLRDGEGAVRVWTKVGSATPQLAPGGRWRWEKEGE